jgi:hypothetical protein
MFLYFIAASVAAIVIFGALIWVSTKDSSKSTEAYAEDLSGRIAWQELRYNKMRKNAKALTEISFGAANASLAFAAERYSRLDANFAVRDASGRYSGSLLIIKADLSQVEHHLKRARDQIEKEPFRLLRL